MQICSVFMHPTDLALQRGRGVQQRALRGRLPEWKQSNAAGREAWAPENMALFHRTKLNPLSGFGEDLFDPALHQHRVMTWTGSEARRARRKTRSSSWIMVFFLREESSGSVSAEDGGEGEECSLDQCLLSLQEGGGEQEDLSAPSPNTHHQKVVHVYASIV